MSALDIAKARIGETESGGKNRSPFIDSLCKAAGVPLGSPWCGAFVGYCLAKVNSKDVPKNVAGSQAWKAWAHVRGRLFTNPDRLMKCEAALFGWTNGDAAHGHVGMVAERRTDANGKVTAILTVEGNTNKKGSRDGDGCYSNLRTVPSDGGHLLYFMDLTGLTEKWYPAGRA